MNFTAIRIVLFVAWYLISTTPLRARLRKLAQTDPHKANDLAFASVSGALGHILKIAKVHVKVEGTENIPADQAVLYVGNHNSYFDIITLGASVPGTVGFVAKDGMRKVPGIASWMVLIHCLFLDRTDLKSGLAMITAGVQNLKDGYSMCIYPEGTRSKDGKMGEFHAGSLKMAQRAKAPVIPVATTGTRAIYEDNPGHRVRSCNVVIRFGKPILIQALPKEERRFASDYTKAAIQELLEK